MKTIQTKLTDAAATICRRFTSPQACIGLILGSGLGAFADSLDHIQSIPTKEIPHWPESTVSGHSGRLVAGDVDGIPIFVVQGRIHYYEGYSMEQVTFPVRVMAALGIETLIVTNASGGFNPDFSPGDIMCITDHINLMGTNPLIGFRDPGLPRFPDMSGLYDPEWIRIAESVSKSTGIHLQKGVLAAMTGPSYETAAEVRMLRSMGADAGCMSTVPEVIVARQLGLRVAGFSCITNLGTGISKTPLSHEEVKETAARIETDFIRFIQGVIKGMQTG